jgi:hypothetical protein
VLDCATSEPNTAGFKHDLSVRSHYPTVDLLKLSSTVSLPVNMKTNNTTHLLKLAEEKHVDQERFRCSRISTCNTILKARGY